MRTVSSIAVFCFLASPVNALDTKDIVGTWQLETAQRHIVDTNETIDAYGGPKPNGWINYDDAGRMMVLVAYQGRQKPTSATPTDQERIQLQRTFFVYAGTYKFDGKKVVHNIDTSWNQSWTDTFQVRDVEYKEGKLIYTTTPYAFSGDGKMSVVTLIWKRPE